MLFQGCSENLKKEIYKIICNVLSMKFNYYNGLFFFFFFPWQGYSPFLVELWFFQKGHYCVLTWKSNVFLSWTRFWPPKKKTKYLLNSVMTLFWSLVISVNICDLVCYCVLCFVCFLFYHFSDSNYRHHRLWNIMS